MKGITPLKGLIAMTALVWVVAFNFYLQPHHLAEHHHQDEQRVVHHHHHDLGHDHHHGHSHHEQDDSDPEHTSDDHDLLSFIQAKQKENSPPTFETLFLDLPEPACLDFTVASSFQEAPPEKELTNQQWFFPNRGPPILLS